MADKHTPGPWFLGISADNGIHCVDAVKGASSETLEVCEVWGTSDDKIENDESNANARLIAAAPELLAALEAARQELADMKDQIGFRLGTLEAIQKCDEAIAKARGDQ